MSVLSNHAGLYLQDSEGKTPAQRAAAAGHKDLAELIVARNLLPEAERAKLDALLRIYEEAEKGGMDQEHTNALRGFLTQSATFADAHPEQIDLWAARASACLDLDYPGEGWLAGLHLKRAGAAQSDDAKAIGALERLRTRGWLGANRTFRDWNKWTTDQAKSAAEAGDQEAQDGMGGWYEQGQGGLARDYEQAAMWYRKAAEAGDSSGQFHLATMYLNGMEILQNDGEAIKWFRKAANAGNPLAQDMMGFICEYKGLRNYAAAAAWYRKSAEAGYSRGADDLGHMYRSGLGVDQSDKTALEWFRKAGEAGDAAAWSDLASMYAQGLGAEQDYAEAAKWWRKKAEAGYSGAGELGSLYEQGLGVKQDWTEAAKWYRREADEAVRMQADRSAFKWYRKAAWLGDTKSLEAVASLFADAGRTDDDRADLVKLTRKFADLGDLDDQLNLGLMYEKGLGVPKDYTEALKWYRKAAEAGDSAAQRNLTRMLGSAYFQADSNPSIQSAQQAILKLYREGLPQTGVGVISIDGIPTSTAISHAKRINLPPGEHALVFGIVNAAAISSYDPITEKVTVEAGKSYTANMKTAFRQPGMTAKQGKWSVAISADNEKGSSNEVTWATFQFR